MEAEIFLQSKGASVKKQKITFIMRFKLGENIGVYDF